MSRIKQRLVLTRARRGPTVRVRRPRRAPASSRVQAAGQTVEAEPVTLPDAPAMTASPTPSEVEPETVPSVATLEKTQAPEEAGFVADTEPSPETAGTAEIQPDTKIEPTEETGPVTDTEAASETEPQPTAQTGAAPAVEHTRDDSPEEGRHGNGEGRHENGDRRPRMRDVRTTGIFTVPADTAMQLVVAISSFAEDDHTAQLWIRRVDGNRRDTVFCRTLNVPAHSVQRVTVDGLDGQAVEVDVRLSSDLLVPTAAVTQLFSADGAIVVVLYKSPGDFIAV